MLSRVFRRLSRGSGPPAERTLGLERELKEVRLELADRERTVERLRADLVRARGGAEEGARQRTRADLEHLVVTIGAPLTQLVTQAHLNSSGTAQVRTADVLEVGTRLVRLLRGVGVETVGEVGTAGPYDPDRHEPLSATAAPAAGAPVVVRVVGLSYEGRIVRKAGVESAGPGGPTGGGPRGGAPTGGTSTSGNGSGES